MKYLLLLSLFLIVSCDSKKEDPAPTDNGLSPYIAEYGVPSQSLLSACAGEQEFARPITRCVRRQTGEIVSEILCSNLPPVYMNVLSPAGDKKTNLRGGVKIDTCNEGSSEVISSITTCNEGFFFYGTQCLGYDSIGNYTQFLDQFVAMGFISNDYVRPVPYLGSIDPNSPRSLILNFTIGAESSYKEKDGLRMTLIQE